MQEVIKEVNDIFIDILDNAEIALNEKTTANDIEDWDSLNHLQLIFAIEKHFNIRFTSSEIQSFSYVGEMCACIERKVDDQ